MVLSGDGVMVTRGDGASSSKYSRSSWRDKAVESSAVMPISAMFPGRGDGLRCGVSLSVTGTIVFSLH